MVERERKRDGRDVLNSTERHVLTSNRAERDRQPDMRRHTQTE
jgi:hypothetical protein